MSRLIAAGLAVFCIAALPTALEHHATPAVLWNTTPSAPVGLYRVHPAHPLKVGDWVAAWPPRTLRGLFGARSYLPLGVPLVKRIAALEPSRVCRTGDQVSVDGRPIAIARPSDRLGRDLPTWSGCRTLHGRDVFLLNTDEASLDGRYFGPISADLVVGRLTPLWIWGGR